MSNNIEFRTVYIQFEKLDVVLGNYDFVIDYNLSFRILMYKRIIKAFNYLNDWNLIYCDVHENNFMFEKEKDGKYYILKMIDFGLMA